MINRTHLPKLLTELTPTELLIMCYDVAELHPFYRRLTRHSDPARLRVWLTESPAAHKPLLAWLRQNQPRLYGRYASKRPENPFHIGRGYLHQPEQFFGRERLLRELRGLLSDWMNVALRGEAQWGRSSVLYHLYATRRDWLSETVKIAYVDLQGVWDTRDFFYEVVKKLGGSGNSLLDFKQMIEGQQVLLLFDEVEQLADADFNPKLQGLLRKCAQEEQFAMCLACQQPLEHSFPKQGPTSPFHNIFTNRELTPFLPAEVREFVQSRLQPSGLTFTDTELDELIQHSHGIPATMQRLARRLFEKKYRRG